MAQKENNSEKKEMKTQENIERIRSGKIFVPAVDIIETDDFITLMADMPGVDKQAINITLEQHTLTIHGNIDPVIPEGFSTYVQEYEIGDFERSFTLNEQVDRENIEASLNNGVLEVRLPKAEPAKPKTITIKAG
jgi:HSP20 family protein